MTTDVSRLMPAARLHGPAKLPSQGASDAAGINAKITGLEQLDLPSLRRRWRDVHGSDAPARLGSEFLRRAMAFHLQEQVFGGLSRHARLRLKALERRPPGETGVSSIPMSLAPTTRSAWRLPKPRMAIFAASTSNDRSFPLIDRKSVV